MKNKKLITTLEIIGLVLLVVAALCGLRIVSKLEKHSPFDEKYSEYQESISETLGDTTQAVQESQTDESTTTLVDIAQEEPIGEEQISQETEATVSDELDYFYSKAEIDDTYNDGADSYTEFAKVNYCIQNIMDANGYIEVEFTSSSDGSQPINYYNCVFDGSTRWFVYYQFERDRAYALKDKEASDNAEYEVAYELFPYQIRMNYVDRESLFTFFGDGPDYYPMIKNYDSYGTYMLEALYNICTMYGYKPDEIEFTDSVRILLDGAYKCKFTARGVNFTLVVNTTMEKGFFISDEERADVNYE